MPSAGEKIKKSSSKTALQQFAARAALLEMEMDVMKMIAIDEPLTRVLNKVVENFEKNVKGSYCSILLLDRTGTHVKHGAAPSLPSEYCSAIDGVAIGPNVGSCGTAAYKKERTIVSDIENDPLWTDFKDLALKHGLKACWSTPILRNDGSVLGTFAIYYKIVKDPEKVDLELIDRSANLVKIAIEQHYRATALTESEKKYRTLAESLPDAITRYDKHGRIAYANRVVTKLTGITEDDLIGRNHYELELSDKQAEFWDASVRSVLETGKSLHQQLEWTRNNTTIYFDWYLNPEFDSYGNVKSVLGVSRDITELKKAEQEILKREKFLAVVTDNFPNSFITVIDRELKIVFNGGEKFTKIHLDSEKYIGRHVSEFFTGLEADKSKDLIDAYRKTLNGEPQFFELEWGDVYLYFKTVPLVTDSGEIKSILVVAEDITKKKEADIKLTNSELLFTRLTANAPVGIFQTDLNGNFTYVNEEWIKYAGISFADAMGDGWINAIHPEDEGRVLIEWQNAISKKKEFKSELRFLTRQGKVTWMSTRAVILYDANHEPYGYIGMTLDITDQKSIYELLEENEKRYRTTLERITDGFVSLDTNWRFTYLNNRAGVIFGCNPDEVIGKKMEALFPQGRGRPFYLAYAKAMRYQRYTYLEEYYPPHNSWYENHIYPSLGGISIYFRDITERKNDEMKLLSALEILEVAEEQAKLGSWELEVSTDKRKWSKQLFRLMGFEPRPDSIPHEEYIIRIHPEDREKFDTSVARMLNGENPKPIVFRTNPEELPLKYLSNTWYAECDTNGNPVKFRGILQDITERVMSEHKVRESEEKYRTLVEQASDAIMIADPSSLLFTQVNSMACTMSGYSREQLLTMTIPEVVIFRKEDPPLRIDEIKEGVSIIQERLLKRKDGSGVPVEINATRLKNGNLLSIVRDITERKNAERALLESENHLRTILDNEPECVMILSKRGELVDMNPAGLAMIQADDLNEIKRTEVFDLVDESHRESFKLLHSNVFKGIIGKLEFRIKGLKGRKLWMETHAVPFRDTRGKIISLLAVTRDITERKNAEEKVSQYTNQLKELTAHLQHVREEERAALSRELHDELGQQLTAIKMDLSWLNNKVETDQLKSKLQETMNLLHETVSTLRRINSELRPSLLDDLGLFPALEYQANEFSKRYNILCSIDISIDEPEFKKDYDIAIFRIFQETLNNIAKHAKASEINVEVKTEKGRFNLTVVDNGKGFDTNDQRKRRSFGILGMTERAMMMSGSLHVKSSPGKGTTLRLSIPVASSILV